MTKYEKEIYRIVNDSHNHLTAEQVYEAVKKVYPAVSRATIYNNLNKLCDSRFIRRVSLEGYPDRYDRIVRHDHLVCEKCGKLMDITLEDLTASLKKQLGENFDSYDLKVFYICDECRKKAASGAEGK